MIKKITFENIRGGISIGTFAFHIEIENTPLKENKINLVIKKMLEFPTTKTRIALIKGKFCSIYNDQMLTLVLALKDKGFFIQVEAPGDKAFPWFGQVNRLIIHINDKTKWPSFPCDEFVLHATKEETPLEPQVPELNSKTVLSLAPGKLSTIKVFVFLNKMTHNWRLYPESANVYIQIVYKKEE